MGEQYVSTLVPLRQGLLRPSAANRRAAPPPHSWAEQGGDVRTWARLHVDADRWWVTRQFLHHIVVEGDLSELPRMLCGNRARPIWPGQRGAPLSDASICPKCAAAAAKREWR